MSSRMKRRFAAEANVVDFQPYLPQKQRYNVRPRNKNQARYLKELEDDTKNIVFAIGLAGTGKTILGVQHGIRMLQAGNISKIVITRPAVSVDEELGFLPGTLNEKMAPWTRPIMDVFLDYYQQRNINRMLEEGIIEISPLAYMRGRTFHDSYIVFDEAQLCTTSQMKMALTRLGENSKMVVTGDLAQADRGTNNGLYDFINRLEDHSTPRISIVRFTVNDIERHPVVQDVLNIYGE